MSHYPPGGGPPPPYGYPPGHPPAPGAYAYVPTPVMMPMPYPHPQPPQPQVVDPSFSQPTYVTNVYYQQPPAPEPVHVVDHIYIDRNPPDDQQRPTLLPSILGAVSRALNKYAPPPAAAPAYEIIDWVPTTPSGAPSFSHRAVVAGKEGWDSSPLWVIRAHHGGELVPGKLAVKHRSAYIPYSGKEVPVHNFELLCAPQHAVRWVSASNGIVPAGAIPAGNTHSGEPLYVGRAKYMRSITPGKVHPSHGCLYMSFGGNEVPHKQYEVLCKVI